MHVHTCKIVLNTEACFSKLNNKTKPPIKSCHHLQTPLFVFPFSLRSFILEETPFFFCFLCVFFAWTFDHIFTCPHTEWLDHIILGGSIAIFTSSFCLKVCPDFSVTSSIVTSIPMYEPKTFCAVCYIGRCEMAWTLGGHIFNSACIRDRALV